MGSNYFERRNIFSDEELVECYLRHQSQILAANELGVSRETVARAVRRSGIPMDGRKKNGQNNRPKITDEQIREEAAHLDGYQICRKYGISPERLIKRAKNAGVVLCWPCSNRRWQQRALFYGCDDSEIDKSITIAKLLERDRGICQICGLPVDDKDIKNGHARSLYPTLDHIIPLSKGGTHTWENVQLAHMKCNAGKCDRMGITVKRREA